MSIRALTNPEPGLLQSINVNSLSVNQFSISSLDVENLTVDDLSASGTITSNSVHTGNTNVSGGATIVSLTAPSVISGTPSIITMRNVISGQNLVTCTGSFGTFGAESSIVTRIGSFANGTYTATFNSTGAGGTLTMDFSPLVVTSPFIAGDALITLTFRQTFTSTIQYITALSAYGGSRIAVGGISFPAGSYAVSGRFCVTCR